MFWLIVALSVLFKLAAAASIAYAASISEFWAGISEFTATGEGNPIFGPDVELFPFQHAQPKIEITGKKALAATSPA
jgi:hypothetical protein